MKTIKLNIPKNKKDSNHHKRALVLSGGGSFCAYQAGVLSELVKKNQYDRIYGVSGGALNGIFMSMYPLGCDEEAVEDLIKFWKNIEQDNLYVNWCPFGILMGIFKKSIKNKKPMIELFNKIVDVDKVRTSGRKFKTGTCNIQSGNFEIFDEESIYIKEAVMGSAAVPIILEPEIINGKLYVDGGIRNFTPIKMAIDDGNDDIDIIITHPEVIEYENLTNSNTIGIGTRTIEIMTNEIMNNDLKLVEKNNAISKFDCDKRKINYRVIRPKHNLSNDSLSFTNDDVKRFIELGIQDGKEFNKNN